MQNVTTVHRVKILPDLGRRGGGGGSRGGGLRGGEEREVDEEEVRST